MDCFINIPRYPILLRQETEKLLQIFLLKSPRISEIRPLDHHSGMASDALQLLQVAEVGVDL